MKKFYTKILVFLLPVLVVWIGAEVFYRTVPTNYTFKDKQVRNEYSDSEILLFGNSHPFYGLNPLYFEKRTFNMANVSQSLYFDELIFNQYIDSLPEVEAIVLSISYFTLSQEDDTSEDAWRKYYYKHQMGLDVPIVSLFDVRNYSLALGRNFRNTVALMHVAFADGTAINSYPNGYGMQDESDIVEDKEAITPIIVKKHEDNLYDYTTNTKRLERIIANCKKRQIEVFLVEMPVYKTYYNSLKVEKRDRVSTTLETLDQAHKNVHYLKLSQDPRFKDKDLRDADHLTNEGAEKASKILNNFIMEQLPNR